MEYGFASNYSVGQEGSLPCSKCSPPLDFILSQLNPDVIFKAYSSKAHLHIVLPYIIYVFHMATSVEVPG
jgi:hypothetical protein